jgi:hypothetical protein
VGDLGVDEIKRTFSTASYSNNATSWLIAMTYSKLVEGSNNNQIAN